MTLRLPVIVATVLICSLVTDRTANAQALSPFGRDVIAVSKAEVALIKKTIADALETYTAGVIRQWQTPSGERAGQVVLNQTFQMRGMKCAEITHSFTKGGGRTYTAPFCQVKDGSWKLAF